MSPSCRNDFAGEEIALSEGWIVEEEGEDRREREGGQGKGRGRKKGKIDKD